MRYSSSRYCRGQGVQRLQDGALRAKLGKPPRSSAPPSPLAPVTPSSDAALALCSGLAAGSVRGSPPQCLAEARAPGGIGPSGLYLFCTFPSSAGSGPLVSKPAERPPELLPPPDTAVSRRAQDTRGVLSKRLLAVRLHRSVRPSRYGNSPWNVCGRFAGQLHRDENTVTSRLSRLPTLLISQGCCLALTTRSGDSEFLQSLLPNPHGTAPFSMTDNPAVTVITCLEGTFWNVDMK